MTHLNSCILVHKRIYWIWVNLQKFQAWMVNVIFEIFLVYHIRKYVNKNFSWTVLVLYMCTLHGMIEKGSLNIKRWIFVCKFIICIIVISLISHKNKQTCVNRNIHWSFEGCRQTFEGYKLTFVYAIMY